MKDEYELQPWWYSDACELSNILPFAGGIVSDYLSKNVSPEIYYYGYHKNAIYPVLTFAAITLAIDAHYLTSQTAKITLPILAGLGFINAGYFYNAYLLEMNRTKEMDEWSYRDQTRSSNTSYETNLTGETALISEFE